MIFLIIAMFFMISITSVLVIYSINNQKPMLKPILINSPGDEEDNRTSPPREILTRAPFIFDEPTPAQ